MGKEFMLERIMEMLRSADDKTIDLIYRFVRALLY